MPNATSATQPTPSNPTRRGIVFGRPSAATRDFLSIKDGDTKTLTILYPIAEIPGGKQITLWNFSPAPSWVDIGADDPSHDLEIKGSMRYFIPVRDHSEKEKDWQLWTVSRAVYDQIVGIADMSDTTLGLIIKVKRAGTGRNTRYTIVSTNRYENGITQPKIDDVLTMLGPDTREEIIAMIEKRASMSFDEVITVYLNEAAASASGEEKPTASPTTSKEREL